MKNAQLIGRDVRLLGVLLCNMDFNKMLKVYGYDYSNLCESVEGYINGKVRECNKNGAMWLTTLDGDSLANFAKIFNRYEG